MPAADFRVLTGDLEHNNHVLWLYQSEEEHRRVIVPFLRRGLEQGEKVIYIADSHTPEDILDYLREDGLDVESYLARGQLVVTPASAVYTPAGAFDPENVKDFWEREAGPSAAAGYRGIRLTGEMAWAAREMEKGWDLCAYEAQVDLSLPGGGYIALCQYDRRLFRPSVLLDLLGRHPVVMAGTELCTNPYYLPPAGSVQDGDPATVLERRLQHLLGRKQVEQDLEQVLDSVEAKQQQVRDLFEALVDSERRNAALDQLITFGIWVCDRDGGLVHVSDSFLELTGTTLEECREFGWTRLMPPEDVEQFLADWRRRVESGDDWDSEYRVRVKDGRYRAVLTRGVPIRDESGNIESWIGINLDITERRKTEEDLRKSESRLRRIIETANEGIWVLDSKDKTTFVNSKMAQMLGYTVAEMIGRSVYEFSSPEDQASMRDHLKARRSGVHEQYDFRLRRKDGAVLWVLVSANPIFDRQGRYAGSLGMMTDITERRAAEEAVRQSNRLLQNLLSSLDEAVFIVSSHSRIIEECNRTAELMFGYSREEMIGHDTSILHVDTETFYRFGAESERALVEQDQFTADFWMRRKNGQVFPTQNYVRTIQDENGELLGVVSVVHDVTERRRAEDALRESEARFRAIFEDAAIGMDLVDMQGRIVESNPAFQEMLGYSAEELRGKTAADFTHPDDFRVEMQLYRETIEGKRDHFHMEKRYYRKDGRMIWVRLTVSLVCSPTGEPRFAIGMVEDITERKRNEEAQRFLAETTGVLTSSLDYDTTLQSLARLAVPYLADCCAVDIVEGGRVRQLAVSCADPQKEEALRDIRRRHTRRPEGDDPIWRMLTDGKPYFFPDLSDSLRKANQPGPEQEELIGGLGLTSAMAVPLVARGRTLGGIYLARTDPARPYTPEDLTLAEELARRAALAVDNARLYQEAQAAIQARDEFLSMAAHQLRTPLTSLRGFAHLTAKRFDKKGTPNPEEVRRALEVIDEQSTRLTKLISQLLDVSTIEAGKLQMDLREVDLASLVQEVVARAQATTNRHTLTVHAPDELPARVDPLQLEQALMNLLDNAIKYSPEGGAVEVELCARDGDRFSIAVRDHGVGIPPQRRDGIFDRFYQGHRRGQLGGLGLGLYLTREIVNRHGGSIEVEFPGDGGTRFVINMPRSRTEPAPGGVE